MSSNERPDGSSGIIILKILAAIVFTAQTAASGILFYKAFSLGIVPDKYLCALGIALWLLLMASCLLLFVGIKRAFTVQGIAKRIVSLMIAIFICFVCTVSYKYMDGFKKTINEVAATEQTEGAEATIAMVNLYVTYSDAAQTTSDCKNYLIGIAKGSNGGYSTAALKKLSSETGVTIKTMEFDSEAELIDALYNGDVDAVLISSSQVEILSETEDFGDISDRLRLIREYEISEADMATIPTEPISTTRSTTTTAKAEDDKSSANSITNTPFIVYLSGSDTRDKKFKTSRSDVNILMAVNPKSKQILLINTPRDYYIPNPKSSEGVRDKLTHLGLYGVDCSMKGLADLYSIKVDYSAQINFTGLETLVDQLGGITIDNPQAFTTVGYTFKKGTITLNGKEALVYARERHAFATGDNMRGQNQMRIITAMINKLTSSKSKLLKNYGGIMNAISGMFRTSMPSSDIEKLVKMQLDDMAQWKISTYAVSGKNGSETTYSAPKLKSYVMWPDDKSVNTAKTRLKRLMAGETL
ncbi:MAG: LCP family protein [Clostridiales bacterium]|nr:LCP family protein [Clostridiales bacterium]